jgi:hypothetical protein
MDIEMGSSETFILIYIDDFFLKDENSIHFTIIFA